MPVQMLRAALVFSALALVAASGRACDDDGGSDGGEEQPPTGNKVDVTATCPTPGVFKADGTLTAGAGWTADGVKLTLFDNAGKQVGQPKVIATGNAFSHKFENLPTGMYTVEAEGLFRKGTNADRPKAKASVVVR